MPGSGTAKKNTQTKRSQPRQREARTENYVGRMAFGIFLIVFGVLIALSYFVNEGSVIVSAAESLKGLFGFGYWLSAVCFIWAGIVVVSGSGNATLRVISVLLIPVAFSALISVFSYVEPAGKTDLFTEANILFSNGKLLRGSGLLPGLAVMGLVSMLSRLGAGIVVFALLLLFVFLAITEPGDALLSNERDRGRTADNKKPQTKEKQRTPRFDPAALISVNESYDYDIVPASASASGQYSSRKKTEQPAKAASGYDEDIIDPRFVSDVPLEPEVPARRRKPAVKKTVKEPPKDSAKEKQPVFTGTATDKVSPLSEREAAAIAGIDLFRQEPVSESVYSPEPEESYEVPAAAVLAVKGRSTASSVADAKKAQEKVTREDAEKARKAFAREVSRNAAQDEKPYNFPDISILSTPKSVGSDSREEILRNKDRLESALVSFGINSHVINITHGPTVTRYDIELEQGVKLSKVTNLSNDLALSLGVSNVRIAPIPDEISTVGIEVPNKIVNSVTLREIIDSDNFKKAESKLSFAIGKDIGGNAIVGNISKLPHMLIAGTTGSGKSVCMNSLILSLLYKARPDEVKFIMIDPKMVELGIYNSIPHLYSPVVTDPKKAAGALQWSVVEMLKRYRLFSEAGVRDLATYNSFCARNGEAPLPQVVIVIDELADLMMAASKEVEESICRIAQMGRAAGMHLVIATQRPSADVITGLMKANIPSRIAFAVSSALESRIILDQGGADKLIGHGDMLYAPIGCGKPLRVQGAFVSDEEREAVIKFISGNTAFEAETNDELSEYMDRALEDKKGSSSVSSSSTSDSGNGGDLGSEYDDMLSQAAEVVLEMKQCSVSMLQRRLKLGYARAARIVDQMEELGIVGPYEGAKPRSVPIDRDGWNRVQVKLGLASADDFALAAELSEEAEPEDLAETGDDFLG